MSVLLPSVCLLKVFGGQNGNRTFEIIEIYAVMKSEFIFLGAVLLTANIFGQATPDPSDGTNYSTLAETSPITDESSTLAETHYIGESLGGGVVFYVDDEGKHGLITTIIDKSTRKQQRSEAHILTNPVRDGITTGTFNTERINVMKGTVADDAQGAEYYQDDRLSDWYLPTRYDLIKLYRNRAVIGGYSDFAKGWKSTETSSVNQWYQSFVTGGEFKNGKDDAVYIRVIRKF